MHLTSFVSCTLLFQFMCTEIQKFLIRVVIVEHMLLNRLYDKGSEGAKEENQQPNSPKIKH